MKKLSVIMFFAVLSIVEIKAQSLVLTCDQYGIAKENASTGEMYQEGSPIQEICVMIANIETNSFVVKIEKHEEINYIIRKKNISDDGMKSVFLVEEPNGYLFTIVIDLSKSNARWVSLNYPKNESRTKYNKVYHVISVGTI
jgi:hypothetical protein